MKVELEFSKSLLKSRGYCNVKHVVIPAWAKSIRLLGNGIDGYPPEMPACISPEDLVKNASSYQMRQGGGEWNVLVYALSSADEPARSFSPYGTESPYLKLRSTKNCKVKLIATICYMRWTFYTFETIDHEPTQTTTLLQPAGHS